MTAYHLSFVLVYVFLLVLQLPSLVLSKAYFPNDLPNPYASKENAKLCGHHDGIEQSKICDPDNFLTKNEIEQIEKAIQDVSTKADVYVIVLDEIAMDYKLTHKSVGNTHDISSKFGIDLYLQWGIGTDRRDGDFGILVLVSRVESYANVIKGTGIANLISQNAISNIIAKATRKPVAMGYTSHKVITDLGSILLGKKTVSHFETTAFGRYKTKTVTLFDLWPIGLLIVAIIMYQLYKIQKIKNVKAGYYMLNELIKDIQSLKNSQKVPNCPHCLTFYESETETLICGHTFCKKCYQQYIGDQSGFIKPSCFICKKNTISDTTTTTAAASSDNAASKHKHSVDYQEVQYRIQRLHHYNSTTFDSVNLQAIDIAIESKNITTVISLLENRKKAVEASMIPLMTRTASKKKKKV